MRTMYDAIRANAKSLVPLKPSMVAIYLTGSSDIRWTTTEVQLFPNAEFVRIDQGGQTSPQFEATVFDVEPGAWSMSNAVAATKKCTAARPTIYCDRSDYKTVPASYSDALWIAAPGLSVAQVEALAATDKRIVAVQNVFAGSFDSSIVLDPNWPNKAPTPPPPPPVATEFEVQLERYQPGFGWVLESTLKTKPGTKYRARVSNGEWSPWQEITIP